MALAQVAYDDRLGAPVQGDGAKGAGLQAPAAAGAAGLVQSDGFGVFTDAQGAPGALLNARPAGAGEQVTTSSIVGVARTTLIRDSSRSNRPSLAAEQANSHVMQPLHLFLSHIDRVGDAGVDPGHLDEIEDGIGGACIVVAWLADTARIDDEALHV